MITLIIFVLTLTSIFANELRDNIISSNNQFAVDLYKELLKSGNENFVASPFSAVSLLALAQSGARGLTQQELRSGLYLPNDQSLIERSFKQLNSILRSEAPKNGYIFHIANKIYVQENYNIKAEFKRISKFFATEVANLDFAQPIQAARSINHWVEKKTERKIRELVSADSFDSNTRAVFLNALYFNGNWSSPFKRLVTRKKDFFTKDRITSQVDMMVKAEQEKTFNYAEDLSLRAQFLELPFQDGDVSMVFVLPLDTFGIGRLEADIDRVLGPQNWQPEYINMTIPKFRFENKIDIKRVLENLGVRRPFSPQYADFGEISYYELFINDVFQKTFIDVHESGVEAAAATYAGFTLLSIQSTPAFKQFHADHPFIFYIKIKKIIVFIGRVGRPSY